LISEDEAIERAKRELTETLTSYEDREVNVSFIQETYVVVFPPPPDTLGGDFTVVVDANTGEVLDVTIER
jgi:uncharacterized membrane protein YkoI